MPGSFCVPSGSGRAAELAGCPEKLAAPKGALEGDHLSLALGYSLTEKICIH